MELPPPQIEEPLLWACDRRYYYKGEFVLEVKGGNLFDAPTVIIQPGFGSLALEPVDMERRHHRDSTLSKCPSFQKTLPMVFSCVAHYFLIPGAMKIIRLPICQEKVIFAL